MLRLRTIILLALTGLCGLKLGLLSFFQDGMYSAIRLFALPFLVALMCLVIVIDIVKPPGKVLRYGVRKLLPLQQLASLKWPANRAPFSLE